jgi:hypothetical protein
MDAAGNIYTTNEISELLQVFSPGGNWIATTSSSGTFTLVPVVGVLGDYNGNGVVDAADYVLWRKNPSAFGGDPAGYNTWRANFGHTSGSGSAFGGAAVPEPGTIALAVFGLVIIGACRRNRQTQELV